MRGWRALLAGLALALPAAVATPAGAPRIEQAEAAVRAAQAADDPAALVEAVRTYEAALAGLRAEVVGAAQRERDLRLALAARHEQVTRLLAALEIATRTPPTTGGLHPRGPVAAARAGASVAALRPALETEAAELAAALAAIDAARREHRDGMTALADGLAGLDAAREALRAALAADPAAPGPDLDSAALIRGSETLTALAAALAGPAPSGEPPPPGELAWPVAGQVVIGYDERDAAGVRRPGLVIAAPPQALVTAPADGEVRYAGPFLDYGYVVVLEPRPGTLVVLAGLAEIHVRAGASVRQGTLLGMLGGRTPGAADYVMLTETGTGAGAEETLYVEIRHGGGPVDPGPWLAGNGQEG